MSVTMAPKRFPKSTLSLYVDQIQALFGGTNKAADTIARAICQDNDDFKTASEADRETMIRRYFESNVEGHQSKRQQAHKAAPATPERSEHVSALMRAASEPVDAVAKKRSHSNNDGNGQTSAETSGSQHCQMDVAATRHSRPRRDLLQPPASFGGAHWQSMDCTRSMAASASTQPAPSPVDGQTADGFNTGPTPVDMDMINDFKNTPLDKIDAKLATMTDAEQEQALSSLETILSQQPAQLLTDDLVSQGVPKPVANHLASVAQSSAHGGPAHADVVPIVESETEQAMEPHHVSPTQESPFLKRSRAAPPRSPHDSRNLMELLEDLDVHTCAGGAPDLMSGLCLMHIDMDHDGKEQASE